MAAGYCRLRGQARHGWGSPEPGKLQYGEAGLRNESGENNKEEKIIMKIESKKLLSILLAAAMVISLFAAMPMTASADSNDAGIRMLGAVTNPVIGSEAGTIANPKTASLTVSNDFDYFGNSQVLPAYYATATVYKDSGFTTAEAINLIVGVNHVYIKVVAEDGTTTLYYDVTVTRQASPTYTATINPTSRTFTGATVGYGSQTVQVFTITNTGTGTLTSLVAALTTGTAFEISTALSGASAASGGTVTVSVRPKTGLTAATYTDTLKITGDNGISISVALSFTVSPVGGSTPGPSGPPAGSGTTASRPAETDIEDEDTPLGGLASFAAFITGYTDNTFRGQETISREEFVNILFKLKNPDALPEADPEAESFADVAPDRWSYDAIEWAKEEGIVDADEDGNFRPAVPITRAEMAVMLTKMEGLTAMAQNTFSDINGHPAKDDILKAVFVGIFNGYPDGTFKPDGSTTRYEAVAALVRYLLGGEPEDETWTDITVHLTDTPRSHWAYKYVALAVAGYTDEI